MKGTALLCVILPVLLLQQAWGQPESVCVRRSFDSGWKFCLGDDPKASEILYNDSTWAGVDIPHDWSLDLSFSKESAGGIATGHTTGGTAWYRKTFRLEPLQNENRLCLYFEGIYMESEVWINGEKIMYHPNGYTSFYCDISGSCFYDGKENVVAVRVRNEGKNSRWYTGSGIYRHVWLLSSGKLHTEPWGINITTPVVSPDTSLVRAGIEVTNSSDSIREGQILATIRDEKNKVVSTGEVSFSLGARGKETYSLNFTIPCPRLWDLSSPHLYKAEIAVLENKVLSDLRSVSFGIRSISFDAVHGFRLNGKTVKLRGGCIHHDNGLLGSMAIDRAEERKAELLLASGYNAVRTAHNPPSEKFLEVCDRLGLLVIDEAFDQWRKPKNPDDYHRFFDEYSAGDLRSMVLRDRNHPSVILWSVGNEIPERAAKDGVEIAERLKKIIKECDQTRPVTAAVNDFWDNPGMTWEDSAPAFSVPDAGGYNYMWYKYESDHRLFPQRVMFGSESVAREAYINQNLVEKLPFVIGDFVWSAIDYLGESGIGHAVRVPVGTQEDSQFLGWPWFISGCGDLDICGNKKPPSLYRDVLWNRRPLALLVNTPLEEGFTEKVSYWGWPLQEEHWNWKGYEGKPLNVSVYTKAARAALFLNGKLLAEKAPDSTFKAVFGVLYEPGELKAVVYDNDRITGSAKLSTTGPPFAIRLKAVHVRISRSVNDLSFISIEITDKNGAQVSSREVKLQLRVKGAGAIAASGNACPWDMNSFRSLNPLTYQGRAQVVLRPRGYKGTIELSVTAEGLRPASIRIKCI